MATSKKASKKSAASSSKKRAAQTGSFYDAIGRKASRPLAPIAADARAISAQACLRLHNGSGVTWNIDITFDPNTYPFKITGGTINGTICGAPWIVTGGSMGPTLTVNAKRQGAGSCANTVVISGNFQNPSSYKGKYVFDGSASFAHTTLYCCGRCT